MARSLPFPQSLFYSPLGTATLLFSCIAVVLLLYTGGHSYSSRGATPALREKQSDTNGEPENEEGSMSALVIKAGYPLQRITVQTEDGYLLNIYRIPSGKNAPETKENKKQVVLLWHGLLDSSATWVLNGAERSLGFILADAGFDVWMGNSRGNTFSRDHIELKIDGREYWDFSFDEMAKHDLSSTINAILVRTKAKQLAYVGHSQGSALGFIKFSQDAALAKKVSIAIMLAPVVFVSHLSSPILRYLARFSTVDLMYSLGKKEFMPGLPGPSSRFFGWICDRYPMACTNFYMALAGYNRGNLDNSHWDDYMAYTPAGSSAKNMVHWAQAVRNTDSTACLAFDYGTKCHHLWGGKKKCNQDIYGTRVPYKYHIEDFGVPLALFWGGKDLLSNSTDVEDLIGSLHPDILQQQSFIPQYEHLDFTWGIDAHVLVYPSILKLISASVGIQ